MSKPTFYEFFAGGGMARAGLGPGWRCLFANDFDAKKAETYRVNWGGEELHVGDVGKIETSQLPGEADLVWASFPCQDLSLAGNGAGLAGERSGTFWPFWSLMKALGKEGRAPRVVALENVCGALTSHGGKDFEKICAALSEEGYRFGALVIDAALFVPQSRPRLFIVAVRGHVELPAALLAEGPTEFHPRALGDAFLRLPAKPRGDWLWWSLPAPAQRNTMLASVVEAEPRDVKWHAREKTQALVEKMSDVHLAKITAARASGERIVGALYRRTRYAEGAKLQRAEARFDGLAGCLRTPAGGSSRQFLMVLEGKRIRSRLISARETARLMGLPDDYILPTRYNDAYHLTGDGVVAPVVRHLAEHLFEPLLRAARRRKAA